MLSYLFNVKVAWVIYVTAFFFFYQANLEEQQAASNQFVRALMTSVCQAAIICKYY